MQPELPGIVGHPALRQRRKDQSEGSTSLTPKVAAQLIAPPSLPRLHLVLRMGSLTAFISRAHLCPLEQPWWGGAGWRPGPAGRWYAVQRWGSSCHHIVPWILEDQDMGRGALGTPLLLYQRQHMRCVSSLFGSDSHSLYFLGAPWIPDPAPQSPRQILPRLDRSWSVR